jgi:hypothetical protein
MYPHHTHTYAHTSIFIYIYIYKRTELGAARDDGLAPPGERLDEGAAVEETGDEVAWGDWFVCVCVCFGGEGR